jgi:3,4-dihydroxy 2-butanone 4-phosphate synthase/GTP cyclohydrolase II
VRTAVAPGAPGDLRQPGHIFPIMAQPGGVLTRAGHTEAGCDLRAPGGLEPAAVIVEIMNDDGTMARRPDLETFARCTDSRSARSRDLIRYRLRNERSGRAHRRAARADRIRRVPAASPTRTMCIATCTWRWCRAA